MKNSPKTYIKKYRQEINYIIFGALTTLVNFLSYYIFYNQLNFSNVSSNIIAWIISVIFAFVVNKQYVFDSRDWKIKKTTREFISFISVRVLTGILDTLIMYLGVDILNKDEMIFKLIAAIIVLVSNYFGSKLFIFKK